MLQTVLQEIQLAKGTINLAELARKLDIERGALDGMIEFWVRKGKLKDVAFDGGASCDATGGCSRCAGPQGCPYVMDMPRTITLVDL